jgi:hypothetical protein
MPNQNEPKSREEIQKAFAPLLRSHEAKAGQISTKAEEAQLAKEREVVDRAVTYTVESIVNDLAKLQLEFSSSVDVIAERLTGESAKLEELRGAIKVEAKRLDNLRSTILVAEALAILEQDHKHKLAAFEQEVAEKTLELEQEIAETRARWAKDAEEHAAEVAEHDAAQAKERAQASADHAYERERQGKLDADADAERRRDVERELADEEAAKVKDWNAREKQLSAVADELAELREKVAAFPQEMEDKVKAARDKAMATVNREAKFAAEMAQKEHDGKLKVAELKIHTLEERIARQTALIAELNEKLDATIAKSQNLAEQAFKRTGGE